MHPRPPLPVLLGVQVGLQVQAVQLPWEEAARGLLMLLVAMRVASVLDTED